MSFYDFDGNPITFGEDLNGYTMEQEPEWDDGKVIYVAHSTNPVGSIGASSVLTVSDYIPVRGRNSLQIMLPVVSDATPATYGMAFYDEEQNVLPMTGTTVYWGRGTNNSRARLAEVFVPDKAKYFRTTWWTAATMESYPETPAFTYTFTAGRFEDSADNITHERPKNRGQLNAIRRVRQLTDIRWTPRVRIPRYANMQGQNGGSGIGYLDWCEVDKEYVGIPYSGSGQTNSWTSLDVDRNTDSGKWGYRQFFVGKHVPIDAFITAARYPNSIMGERDELETVSTYASIYGDVCSATVAHSLALPGLVWPITTFMSNANYGKNWFFLLGTLGTDFQVNDIWLGDVWWNDGHIAIISDLIRDENGDVSGVEISEATSVGHGNKSIIGGELGGCCRRKVWSADELMVSPWQSKFQLYRFKSWTAIPYEKSPFVDTGNEGDYKPIVDLPCIPYLGNKAVYKTTYIVNTKICIGAEGFQTLVVEKDGAEFNRFAINGATEIETGFSAVGSYSAYLLDSNNKRTMSCTWTVENP